MASSSLHLISPVVVPVNSGSRYFSDHPILLQLEKCSDVRQLKAIHAKMLRAGLFSDPYSASKLIQVAALSGVSSLGYAQKVFDEIPRPNLYSWNALIRSYSSSEEPIEAIMMFVRMLYEGVELPNKFTFPFVIKASGLLSALRFGKGVHGMVAKSESADDLFILNSLIHFYSACSCLDMAYQVFLSMPRRDIVSWNSMIVGFAQAGYVEEALDLFHAMEREDQRPNDVTMVGVLSACGKKQDLDFGRSIHSYISTHGFNKNLILNNAILDMYVKCGSIEDAKRLFDEMEEKDKFSWTTMIVGFAKINDFDSARRVFQEMPEQDTAAWNALISAYEKSGNPKEALSVFHEMQMSNKVKPDAVTLVCALSACAQMGLIDSGGWIHVYIKKHRMKLTCHLATSLIDMYSKCGDLEKAIEVFESLKSRDVFVWSSMIGGFAMHGKGKEAKELFLKMQEAKVSPNSVTFTNLLTAFSHSGLVDDGKTFFAQMEPVFGVVPELKHYACLVDILGRAGKLKEAVFVIENMPISPGASVWGALLAACGLHCHNDSDLAIAERACTMLLELEPDNDGAYVLLSNIYAKSGRWDKVSSLRKLMRNSGVRKEPGCSSIEVDGIVHEFLVGDSSHPQSEQIYSKLDEVAGKLKSIGYVPKKSQVLQFVEEEDMQEQALSSHSEKLAMAFGLINTSPNQPIRIIKNLRVCSDCHAVAKLISKIYDREILLRDRVRFHRFKGGSCSCMDYW